MNESIKPPISAKTEQQKKEVDQKVKDFKAKLENFVIIENKKLEKDGQTPKTIEVIPELLSREVAEVLNDLFLNQAKKIGFFESENIPDDKLLEKYFREIVFVKENFGKEGKYSGINRSSLSNLLNGKTTFIKKYFIILQRIYPELLDMLVEKYKNKISQR